MPGRNQMKKKKTSLEREGRLSVTVTVTFYFHFWLAWGMCHHNCFHSNRIMRITQHGERKKLQRQDWERRRGVEDDCRRERTWEQLLPRKQAEEKESCSFPRLLTLLTNPVPLSLFCAFLPPGSGKKWARALVDWALKSFGYHPSVALYLQPSVKGPPAAIHRSTSLPWPRGAGARSGDGAGIGT